MDKEVKERLPQELKKLLALGEEQGFLTYGEVNRFIVNNDFLKRQNLNEIYNYIKQDCQIPIIKDDDIEEFFTLAKKVQESAESSTITSDDMVKQYLNELSESKLLTMEEEIELAKRIERGDEQAKKELIKANLRLVVSI